MKASDSKKQQSSVQRSSQPFFGAKSSGTFFAQSKSDSTPFFRHSGPAIQAKLTVGAVGDKYEQEADRVAADVVAKISDSSSQGTGEQPSVHRMGEEEEDLQMKPVRESVQRMDEEEEELQMKPISEPMQRMEMEDKELQMKPIGESVQRIGEEEEELQMKPMVQRVGAEDGAVSTDFESQLNAARGGGQSLAPDLQAQMGQAMGADFRGVRVHTDGRADGLNQAVGARAFTTGQDLFFKRGEYQPGSRSGQELIAHELTHVMQQQGGNIQSEQPDLVQKKAYVGNNYQDVNECDEKLDEREEELVNDDKTRRFSDLDEFRRFASNPHDSSVDYIGEMGDENEWIRVDEFTVLGEDHGDQKAPSIISAVGTNRYRYEGFSDFGEEIRKDEKFLELEADKRERRFEHLGLAEDKGIHEAESIIPKYARVMPDAIAVIGQQRNKPIKPNQRTTKAYGKIDQDSTYEEKGGYDYDRTIISSLKDILIYTRSLYQQKDNPFGKFYGTHKDAVDLCIVNLGNALSDNRVPNLSKETFPLNQKHLRKLKNIFVKEARKELGLTSKKTRRAWENDLAMENASDQQYTKEAQKLDQMRDISMYQTIEKVKDQDLLFIIGDDHRRKLKPVLEGKGVKSSRDKDFIKEQKSFNSYAEAGNYNQDEDVKSLGEWLSELKKIRKNLRAYGWGREKESEEDWVEQVNYQKGGDAMLPMLENTVFTVDGSKVESIGDGDYEYKKDSSYTLTATYTGDNVKRKEIIYQTPSS